MKYKIILLFIFCFGFFGIQAQIKRTIIDSLETYIPGEGVIKIICDPKIKELIGTFIPESRFDEANYIKTKGFRLQVFMSNDAKTARKEMTEKRSLIIETFPEIAVYDDYAAPNWKLFAGDFLTKEEADVFKRKLLKSIPQLGKEMYVVSGTVNIPLIRRY